MDEPTGRFFQKPMRIIDPTLVWEDHSVLFALFRERRRKVAPWRRMPPPIILLQLAIFFVGLMLALLGFLLLFFNFVLCLACWGMVSVLAAAEHAFIKPRREVSFPHRVASVWTLKGVPYPDAATEMWLTGIRGAEVAKAIYLERMESRWLFVLAYYPFMLLVQLVVFPIVAPYLTQWTISLFGALMVGGFGAAMTQLRLAAMGAWSEVSALAKLWKEGAGIPLRQREQLKDGAGLSHAAAGVAFYFFLTTALFWYICAAEIRAPMQMHLSNLGMVGVVGFVAAALVLFGFAGLDTSAEHEMVREKAEYLDTANFAFEAYMVAVVQGDEKDARRWASWAHDPHARFQRFPRELRR